VQPASMKPTRSRGNASNTPWSTMLVIWIIWANAWDSVWTSMNVSKRSPPK